MVHSFAAKLAAFILNSIPEDTEIEWSKTGGFSGKQPEVSGILPLLHMNVSKEQFTKIIKSTEKTIGTMIKKRCISSKTESILDPALNFKCEKSSIASSNVMVDRFIETIESGYGSRRRGKKHTKSIAKYMKWQLANGKIPVSSTIWFRELRGVEII